MAKRKKRGPNSSDRLKKAQLSFYPEPEDYAALKALSTRTGVPQQVYLRRGLQYILETNDPSRMTAALSTATQRARDALAQYQQVADEWMQLRRRVRRSRGIGRRKTGSDRSGP